LTTLFVLQGNQPIGVLKIISSKKIKIGVFDSGIGGLSVANAIENELPECEIVYRNDTKNVPYGSKPKEEIKHLVLPILKELQLSGCKVIVIACNTVTTLLIGELRQIIDIPLVAVEPMVKTGAEITQNNIITVCATPATVNSSRYKYLKQNYAKGIKILEPDCSDWSFMIETNNIDREKIHEIVDESCKQGSDVIVLACTHYHWIEEIIVESAQGRAKVLQPEKPVVEQLKRVLKQLS
jgi:glutamate racemase